ncbi:MAG: basic amino acid ABC transporter substrate-binding protein [Clostridiales bacterium]|nr:basic amino acid ABC transporter substrate-binding protein [Clostridiales bacterium]
MKKAFKTLALILAAIMVVMSFASCGGTATADPSAANDTTAAIAETSPAIADGILTVGTNAAFPPFEYAGDDGKPDGFDIALIKLIGEKIGVEVVIEDLEFSSLVTSIGNKIDAAIAGMTITEERLQTVDFSTSYYEAMQYVIVKKDNSDITTADDLKGKTIGTQLGTTGEFLAEDDIENANVKTYDKAIDAVNDLRNGRVDAVIIDRNPASVFVGQYPDELKIAETVVFDPEEYGIALPKGDAALKTAVDNALAEIKASGEFDALVEQYINN